MVSLKPQLSSRALDRPLNAVAAEGAVAPSPGAGASRDEHDDDELRPEHHAGRGLGDDDGESLPRAAEPRPRAGQPRPRAGQPRAAGLGARLAPSLAVATQPVELPLSRPVDPPAISPRMTAVLGGLFGLATIASIFALLIQVFPVQDQRAAVAAAAAATSAEPGEQEKEAPPPHKPLARVRKVVAGPWRLAALDGQAGVRIVRGELQRRSFIVALDEAGVPKAEIYRILKAMEGVRKFDHTRPRDSFAVALDTAGKVQAFEYTVGPTEIYQARTGDDGLLHGDKLDMQIANEVWVTSFYVGKDIDKSYQAAGLEPGILAVINRAFNGTTSTEAFEEGGVVKVIAVETTALGRFAHYERLEAVEYRPPDPAKPPIRAYYCESGGKAGYCDEQGKRPTAKGWRFPVPGAPVTSHFNPKRMHPVLKRVMPHNGTDFGAPTGTPVYAVFRGEVELVGMHGASGNLVLIQHPNGVQTGYAHLSRFAPGLTKGKKVGTRQLIGYVGSTGRSTGPHLHFSAKRNGQFFNALELNMDRMEKLPVEQLATFLAAKKVLDIRLDAIPTPLAPEPEPPPEPSAAADDGEPGGDEPGGDAPGDDAPGDDARAERPSATAPADDPPSSAGTDLLGEDLSGDIE